RGARPLGCPDPGRDEPGGVRRAGARRRGQGGRVVRPRGAVLAVVAGTPPLLGHARPLRRFGPLHEREFRLLFTGRTISMLGSAMARVGLAFAVLDLTGSTTDLGLVPASAAVSTIVRLLFGGVWADRLQRHRVMV